MLLLASFMTGRFSAWRDKWRRQSPGVPDDPEALIGRLAWFDCDAGSVVAAYRMASPSGIVFSRECLVVNSMMGNTITAFNPDLSIAWRISHPLLCDLHSIVDSSGGYLITSSGVDGALEFTPGGKLIWSWLAPEHGYSRTNAGGVRRINPLRHYGLQTPVTETQSTHCNSAVVVEPGSRGTVAMSLFHQGEVILIDRRSGRSKSVIQGLMHPHSLRRVGIDGWSVCDTGANSIVLLDANLRPRRVIDGPFDWVQDALCETGSAVVMDVNHARIVHVDIEKNVVMSTIDYTPEWKGYQLEPVPDWWASAACLRQDNFALGALGGRG